MVDPYTLPDDLPTPIDDGAADHLPGLAVPALALPSTDGRTGPDPGARGCTPKACGFRDHYAEPAAAGAGVFGTRPPDRGVGRETSLLLTEVDQPLLSRSVAAQSPIECG
jgi:hypothetical protein